MQTDTSPTPEPDDRRDEDVEDDGQRTPFAPKQDDDTPLGDTDQHSDADA